MEMQEERRLKRTTTISIIVKEVEEISQSFYDPKLLAGLFDEYPIVEVRTACLEELKRSFYCLGYLDWAKDTVRLLVNVGDFRMAKNVMEGCATCLLAAVRNAVPESWICENSVLSSLCSARPNHWLQFVQMVSFVCDIALSNASLFEEGVKIICSYMYPEELRECFYHKDMQCARQLLIKAIERVATKYHEDSWDCAFRVLRTAMYTKVYAEEDRTFVEVIQAAVTAHEKDIAGPNVNAPLLKVANLAILKEALRILTEQAGELKQKQ